MPNDGSAAPTTAPNGEGTDLFDVGERSPDYSIGVCGPGGLANELVSLS